jgi:hypothetical protein
MSLSMASFAKIVLADPPVPNGSGEKQHCDERLDNADLDPKNVQLLTPEQERKLWRKVDIRLMPILSLMYLLCYLDRGASRL